MYFSSRVERLKKSVQLTYFSNVILTNWLTKNSIKKENLKSESGDEIKLVTDDQLANVSDNVTQIIEDVIMSVLAKNFRKSCCHLF